ncbi:MAG: alpha-E domain-containing protein, partial [Gammaproteobacteria bacterium]
LCSAKSYYASMNEPIEREPVLECLFTNTELPRSYARCVDDIRRTLRRIPRADRPLRAANRIIRNLKQVDVRALEGETLHDFIDECQLELATLHDEIGKTYFYFKPRRRRA